MADKNINLEIKLPKVPDIELVALEGLDKMGRHLGISDDKIGEARILVTEAVINGLEHAGEDNPYVNVEFTMTKDVAPEKYDAIFGLFAGFFADVEVKPAAGTLRVVEALAIPGMLVEYEFWAAR